MKPGAVVAPFVVALAVLPAGCDAGKDLTEGWVEQTAERNRQALLETQREELPLPEDVPVHHYEAADLERPADFEAPLVEELVIGDPGGGRGSDRGDDRGVDRGVPRDGDRGGDRGGARRGDPEGDPVYLFEDLARSGVSLFQALAVDGAGRIHVLERGGPEVRVFGPDGGFLRRFGQLGQGPGDLMNARGIALAGDHLLVFHRGYRTSVWTPEGEFIEERLAIEGVDEESLAELGMDGDGTLTRRPSTGEWADPDPRSDDEQERLRRPDGAFGLTDGSTIVAFRVRATRRSGRVVTRALRVFSRFEDGEETVRYLAVPNWARAAAAASPRGDLYVGMFGHLRTEHFIVALAPDGTPRWMMISPWSPDRPPQVDLRVDGRGRLWAFPWVAMREGEDEGRGEVEAEEAGATEAGAEEAGAEEAGAEEAGAAEDERQDPQPGAGAPPGVRRDGADEEPGPPRPRPAWVFSPEGELLAVGTLRRRPLFWNWQVAVGDRVYGIRRDAGRLEEWEVVRYRLEVPF